MRLFRYLRYLAVPWPLAHSRSIGGHRYRVIIWWPDVPRLEHAQAMLEMGWVRLLARPVPADRTIVRYRGQWLK